MKYHDMIEEMAMCFPPAAASAGLLDVGTIGVRSAGTRAEWMATTGDVGVNCLRPGDIHTRHPNHLVTIASTHSIAWMRTYNTQFSQENNGMVNVKLHLGGINAPRLRDMHMMPSGQDGYEIMGMI